MFDSYIIRILLTIPGIIIGFAFHEYAHAFVADRLGDPTPRSQGKLTLDPRAHIDPLGFLMIVIVGFGWARPVQTDRRYLKNPTRDDILISAAGPIMNLLIAIFFAFVLKLFIMSQVSLSENISSSLSLLLQVTISINIVLFVLNLIPFPFFDGYHILANLVPVWKYRVFQVMEQYSTVIFILLAVSGILSKLISPPINFIYNTILRYIIF